MCLTFIYIFSISSKLGFSLYLLPSKKQLSVIFSLKISAFLHTSFIFSNTTPQPQGKFSLSAAKALAFVQFHGKLNC